MSLFPRIQSPCPYKGSLTDIMDGEICRLCKKTVIDLTTLDDNGRRSFLEGCEGEVCVSYRVLLRPTLAAAAAGFMALAAPVASAQGGALEVVMITAGGMRAPHAAEWVEQVSATDLSELPIIYEDSPITPRKEAEDGVEVRGNHTVREPTGT